LKSKNRKPGKAFTSAGFVAFASGSLSKDIAVTPGYYAVAYRFVNSATGQSSIIRTLPVSQVSFAIESGTSKKAA
jgi:hypothetical protein